MTELPADDRTLLGFVYDSGELVAKLYSKQSLAEFEQHSLYTVSRTPAGERVLVTPVSICPECGGWLEHQTIEDMQCLDCGTIYQHHRTSDEHVFVHEGEPVAREPIETGVVMSDSKATDAPSRRRSARRRSRGLLPDVWRRDPFCAWHFYDFDVASTVISKLSASSWHASLVVVTLPT